MSASLQTNSSQPLFTIEQIELVRRLRNSGMTKESIIEAYESFDRLEGELGNLFNIPRTAASTSPSQQQQQQRPLQTTASTGASPASLVPVITGVSSLAASGNFSPPSSKFSLGSAGTVNLPGNTAGFVSPPANFPLSSSGHTSADRTPFGPFVTGNAVGTQNFASGASKFFPTGSDHAGFSSPNKAKLDAIGADADESNSNGEFVGIDNFSLGEDMMNELDAFLRKGFTAAVEEIRKYVNDNSIRQTQIAAQSFISQPYISRFLRGDGRDMSERRRCSIYLWYLQHKKGMFNNNNNNQESVRLPPASTLLQMSHGREAFSTDNISPTMTAFPGAMHFEPGHIVPDTVKRERFTFRGVHREILEDFFSKQPYPNPEEREALARQCNEALQKFIGHELCDRGLMTPTHVANWFNNRRKELKKLAREEGFNPNEVLQVRSRSPLRKKSASFASATSSPTSAGSEKGPQEEDSANFDSTCVVIPVDDNSPIEIKEEATED